MLERADEVLAGMCAGSWPERLAAIADRVVARELDVLLGPGEDGPVGFTSGAIDLVYRDPRDDRLVGVLSVQDIRPHMFDSALDHLLLATDLMAPAVRVVNKALRTVGLRLFESRI